MKCKKCEHYNAEDDVCNAFPQCSGQDCDALLPCEIERRERNREKVRRAQRKRREAAAKNGICVVCVKNPARPGMKTCKPCCDMISKSNSIRLQNRKKR